MHLLIRHDDTLDGKARMVRSEHIIVVTDNGEHVDISPIVKRVNITLEAGSVALCEIRVLKFQVEGMAEALRRDLDAMERGE